MTATTLKCFQIIRYVLNCGKLRAWIWRNVTGSIFSPRWRKSTYAKMTDKEASTTTVDYPQTKNASKLRFLCVHCDNKLHDATSPRQGRPDSCWTDANTYTYDRKVMDLHTHDPKVIKLAPQPTAISYKYQNWYNPMQNVMASVQNRC